MTGLAEVISQGGDRYTSAGWGLGWLAASSAASTPITAPAHGTRYTITLPTSEPNQLLFDPRRDG